MKHFSLILLVIFSVFGKTAKAQTSTFVIYRLAEQKFDNYFLRAFIGSTSLDTLPMGNAVYYSTQSYAYNSAKVRIENSASWPTAMLKLNSIANDTTYLKVSFAKDKFGNPSVLLKVVPAVIAKSDLSVISAVRAVTDERILGHKSRNLPSKTGTGFLVSRNGYIITNYHVVDGGKEFKVRNVNGHRDSSYTATVVVKDDKNDLAILKLSNADIRFDSVPYNIKNMVVDLGEKIEIFGYPLTTTMGEDVKLTSGIISSINGYQDEANSYQLSAPVQPGNSGGPVFDEKGNLIAVVNAKHLDAENVTYGIKSTYLLSFLQSVPNFSIEKSNVELWRMSLTEQAKILKKFVYIIEVN